MLAAQSEDSEYFEDEQDNVPQITTKHNHATPTHLRICEFCGSSNTPTWRRGPGGKGSLCNACGIKWRLRKRTKKGEQSTSPEKKIKPSKAPTGKRKRRDKENDEETSDHMSTLRKPIVFKDKPHNELIDDSKADNRKNYYCKYCDKTWDFNHFKNSQQFGAHCSNCSRRPRQDGPLPHPLYYQDSAPTNLILILRYLQDELSEFEEETNTPPSPTAVVPTPTSSTTPTVPQFSQLFSLPRSHAPLPSAANNPLNTLRLAAFECWSTAAVG